MLLGNSRRVTEFVDEVNAHEVSHQWWGHVVGWSSYHDQWMSEGFAFFSAGLYLKMTEQKPEKYLGYWKHAQEMLLEKNEFGLRANDAGPVWLGWRSSFHKSPGAYQALAYRKGGFALHMLQQMMYDRKNGDKAFIEMMQDYVKTFHDRNASTEGFERIVEKHMSPKMDLAGDKSMSWFFIQWLYGTEVPRYRLDYTLAPQADGKCLLTGTITQSDVSQGFRMLVPVYLDFEGGKPVRLGEVTVMGSGPSPEFKVMLPQKPKRVLINANYDVLASESVSVGK
jgi:aminopeptidase N